jgi:hypothetical protein
MSQLPDSAATIEFGRYKASILIAHLLLRKRFFRLFTKYLLCIFKLASVIY